jgi:hypothetical protein
MTYTKIKFEIKRKPPPPALEPFECLVCREMIERDPYRPDLEQFPVCYRCTMRTPTMPQLAGVTIEYWSTFYRAHALLCALKQEIDYARHH